MAEKLRLDHVHLDPSQIEEAGEYDLEGLFVRLGYAIDAIGAQRVLLDTIEALFVGSPIPVSCGPSYRGSLAGSKTKA